MIPANLIPFQTVWSKPRASGDDPDAAGVLYEPVE